MNWKELITLAREMAAFPPSHHLHQTCLRLAVSTVYYAVYHALARSNADLLVGPSETSEWNRVYMALGGDSAHELMRGDFSRHPETIRRFVDEFLAAHNQRLLAEEDPLVAFTVDQAQAGLIGPRRQSSSSCPSSPNNAGSSLSIYCSGPLGWRIPRISRHRTAGFAIGLADPYGRRQGSHPDRRTAARAFWEQHP